MTTVEFPSGIKVLNPNPLDAKMGPYSDLATAKAQIPLELRYEGLTVIILGDGDYYWESDLSNDGLKKKIYKNLKFSSKVLNYSGLIFSQAVNGLATTTLAGVANRILAHPIIFDEDVIINQFDIEVSTAVVGSLIRLAIYESNPITGSPSNLLSSSPDLLGSTIGAKIWSNTFTFLKGKKYWLTVHNSSTATLRAYQVGGLTVIAESSGTTNTQLTAAQFTSTYVSGAPATLAAPTLVNSSFPRIRLRQN